MLYNISIKEGTHIFVDIRNWEGYYKINEYGKVLNVKTGNYKKPDKNSAGYLRITLQNKNHKPSIERILLHRLVAEHFIPNEYGLKEVNHIDGDIENNKASNLEWCTRKENELHSRKYGKKEYKPFKVIFNDDNIRIFDVKQDLADIIGVSRALVKNWLHKKSKTYINYNIKEIYYIA